MVLHGTKAWDSVGFFKVKLPEPLGPKLFILGEPVLHRYYTVYDWQEKKVPGKGVGMNKRLMGFILPRKSGNQMFKETWNLNWVKKIIHQM